MKKYLIVSKEGDFISKSRNIKAHTVATNGNGIMIYDKDGILINSSTKHKDGIIKIHGNVFYDGEPRQWVIDAIKKHNVGDTVVSL